MESAGEVNAQNPNLPNRSPGKHGQLNKKRSSGVFFSPSRPLALSGRVLAAVLFRLHSRGATPRKEDAHKREKERTNEHAVALK